jgi:hypothetical protein
MEFKKQFILQYRDENFTIEALDVLYDYCIEYEESVGERLELDVIGLCSDFTEYTMEEVMTRYSNFFDVHLDMDDDDKVVETLRSYTTVIEIPNTDRIIVRNF